MERLEIDFDVELNEHELRIATQLVPPDEGAKWEEIGGHDEIIRDLQERVINPLRAKARGRLPNSSLFNPAKGVLFYGPPGCGKTLLARAVASDVHARFLQLEVSLLTDKWYGESQKLAAAVFSLAKKLQPCIIFVDEIDSFLRNRQLSDNEATAMMKAQFMSLWDGFSSSDDIVIVMGATNRPFDLDDAILRRMPTRFSVKLPVSKLLIHCITSLENSVFTLSCYYSIYYTQHNCTFLERKGSFLDSPRYIKKRTYIK